MANEPDYKKNVTWSTRARSDMRAMDRQTALEILHGIDRYLSNQPSDVKFLRPPLSGCRLRIGDWRVLFDLLDEPNSIEVNRVLHRSRAYLR